MARTDATHPAPDWSADLIAGTTAEKHHQLLLGVKPVITANYENKVDRHYLRTGNLYLEVEQSPRGEGYKPSGISIYAPDTIVAIFAGDSRGRVYGPAILVASATDLRAAVNHLLDTGQATLTLGGGRGTNPTRGLLVTPHGVIAALAALADQSTFDALEGTAP